MTVPDPGSYYSPIMCSLTQYVYDRTLSSSVQQLLHSEDVLGRKVRTGEHEKL